MPHSSYDRDDATSDSAQADGVRHVQPVVVVVGRSRINLVVLSRIAERSGTRVFSEAPEAAAAVIERSCPAIVVLDGGEQLRDCDAAMETIMAQKRLNAGRSPFVVMLAPNNDRPAAGTGGAIDAYVSKPVTPERLQPLIERVLAARRDR